MGGEITVVFWDVVDFPIPRGHDLFSVRQKFKEALEREGTFGEIEIMAYDSLKPYTVGDHFEAAGMKLSSQADDKITRLSRMYYDMVNWVYWNVYSLREKNMMVIANDISGEGDMSYFLEAMDARGYNVFLVVPDGCPPENVPFSEEACLIWHWSSIVNGGFSIGSVMFDLLAERDRLRRSPALKRQSETDDDDDSVAKRQRETDAETSKRITD